MLNDDADSTGFYSTNERDVRYESYDYTLPTNYNPWSIGYGGGSSEYPFMPITDPSHTFHSASSSGHHVTEEHVIEVDEEDEIDSQDDVDDNENMNEGDDEPLFDIARSHLITIVVIVANQDIIEVHVQGYNPLITIKMDQLPGPIDHSVLYAQKGYRSQLVYICRETEVLKCWEHHRSLGRWPVDPRIVEHVHRSGLFHLTQVQWIRLDWALITALAERWSSETQTFHLRHGEMSITL
ncbi:hypothetical protein Taro_027560 [Colocasia esculenta]|uniref:Aminotransferase-like plant mobile domain-containing protein n=1 Tax=Colocasia esculenta TaxID=4460 RepID=A0A843VEV5_COLES|nr:hypothetical protein [Colocasia esculenta]